MRVPIFGLIPPKKTDGMTDLTIRETIERTYDTNDSPTDFWVTDKIATELLDYLKFKHST